MSTPRALAELLASDREEIARRWLDDHLAATTFQAEREVVREVHARSAAVLEALAGALAGPAPEDWGSFAHREAVQLVTLMACALAEADASAATAAALVPALIRALERAGADAPAAALLPLAGVAGEGFVAARLAAQARRELDRLAHTAPVLHLPGGVVVVVPPGAPDRRAAEKIVDRALRAVLRDTTGSPLVVLHLEHLVTEDAASLSVLLNLPEDVAGLGGRCLVTGLGEELRDLAAGAGLDLGSVEVRERLTEALSERLRPRLFHRRGRR